MMTAALGIGLVCGILAVSLNWSVHTLRLFIAGLDLGWRSIFFPALGAGIAVFFVRYLMHDNEGHGVSSVIKAIAMGSGSLRRRMIYSRFFGSFLTVGSGGSTGLEGPIVSIGGAMGSALGRWLDMNERHKKLLVGYGAAGAVAGIFNAPLTGLIFSLEIIIGEWTYLTILPTIIAAVSATEVSRWIMGNKIAFFSGNCRIFDHLFNCLFCARSINRCYLNPVCQKFAYLGKILCKNFSTPLGTCRYWWFVSRSSRLLHAGSFV